LGDFVIDRSGEGAIRRQPFEDFGVFEDGEGFGVHGGGNYKRRMKDER